MPSLALEDVTGDEIAGGLDPRQIDLGRWRRSRSQLGLPPIRTTIRRTLPSLWQMGIDAREPGGLPNVRYELIARDGRRGYLSHVEHPSSGIRVTIEPRHSVVKETDGEVSILEGGLTLTLSFDEARRAGTYAGTMTVVVHSF